jgi:hypothetical protein
MSQQQRIVVAITLVAALFLSAPAPARAAAPKGGIPAVGAWERAWSWLVELIPGGVPHRQTARWEKEGGMINPDGHTTPSTSAPAPPADSLDEGGMINPDGHK